MVIDKKAFNIPIEDGNARILIKIKSMLCEVENSAPDFISMEQDTIHLKVELPEELGLEIPELSKPFEVRLVEQNKDKQTATLELVGESIWFNLNMDEVKDIWVSDLNFTLESKNSRYLAYYLKEVDHQFEWLYSDLKSGEIKTMSVSKKKYKAPKISGKETFSASEVIRCADMLNRAIRKIDLRTGGAYIRFNTDKGRLEPLIIGIAEQLGYVIQSLPKEVIVDMNLIGENVSHSIYLSK